MVHTLHTMYEDYYEYINKNEKISKAIINKILKHFLRNYKYLIVPSNKVKLTITKTDISNLNISVIPTGIDLNMFKQTITKEEKNKLLKKYKINSNNKLLVTVSRIGKEKNIEELIDIMSRLYIMDNSIKLLIVGDGPNKNNLIEMVKKLKLENNVVFTGMINPQDIYINTIN